MSLRLTPVRVAFSVRDVFPQRLDGFPEAPCLPVALTIDIKRRMNVVTVISPYSITGHIPPDQISLRIAQSAMSSQPPVDEYHHTRMNQSFSCMQNPPEAGVISNDSQITGPDG